MGFDLSGAGGDFRWTIFDWHKLLRIAKRYGWKPAGTVFAAAEWGGGYTSNDSQTVTADDARQLADALERALADIPEEDVLARHRPPEGDMILAPGGPAIDDMDWFWGPGKDALRQFIRFCRAGAFQIG